MAGVFARGTMKPPLGAQVNGAHPLAQGLLALTTFDPPWPASTGPRIQMGPGLMLTGHALTPYCGLVATPTSGSNREGWTGLCHAGDKITFPTNTDSPWLPANSVTITLVRRKLDTTDRTHPTFALNGDPTFECYCPYSDGSIIWRYGGGDMTITGLSFSTAIPEHLIFIGGATGKRVWQNGVKVGTSATPVTHAASSGQFVINDNDEQEFNYFAVYGTEWSDALCQWWSATPYAHLYPETARTYELLTPGSFTTPIQSVGTAAGVATVAGVGGYRTGHPHSGFGAQKKARRHNR